MHIAFSQDAGDITMLRQKLNAATTDTGRSFIYSRLCFSYCNINIDSALFFGNKSMEFAMKAGDEKSIASANNVLGWTYTCKGETGLAEKYLTTALQQFEKAGDKNSIAIPLANLGNMYLNQSNYPLALTNFTRALKLLEETKDNFRAAEMLFSIGRIYNLEKNPEMARKYFRQAYNIHKTAGDELYMAQALSSIANTYQLQGNYDTALYYYKKLIPVFLKHNDLYRTGNAYENIAIAYENKNENEKALKNMLTAKEYYQRLNTKTDIAYVYSELADIYNAQNNIDKAIENYDTSLIYSKEINDRRLQQSVLEDLSGIYVKKNDFKKAYSLLNSSNQIKDSLFTKEKQDQLIKLQTEFETERNEKENQQLKAQNLASSLQLERNREWLIIVTAALLITGILLFALYRNRHSKIKNIENLKNLNSKLEEQKEEISRINSILKLKALRAQMNPHFIFNCMSSIQECMLTGRINDANIYLSKLSRLLRMVLNYSDEENISLDKELQMLTLYLQLEKVRLKNNFEFIIEIDEEISTDELLVPSLILQPIAENAIWHGLVSKTDNRKLTITSVIKHEKLFFYILDNGIGRKKAAEMKNNSLKNTSWGIGIIEKRLSVIGQTSNTPANLIVHDLYDEAGNASGTCVELQLPLMVI